MTEKQRQSIEVLLREERWTRDEIAARVGVQPASVSAVKALMTMRHAPVSEPARPAKDLPRIALTRKCGNETFHRNGTPLGFHLLDFGAGPIQIFLVMLHGDGWPSIWWRLILMLPTVCASSGLRMT